MYPQPLGPSPQPSTLQFLVQVRIHLPLLPLQPRPAPASTVYQYSRRWGGHRGRV